MPAKNNGTAFEDPRVLWMAAAAAAAAAAAGGGLFSTDHKDNVVLRQPQQIYTAIQAHHL